MELGANLPEVPTGVVGFELNPIIQGQREIDREVERVNRPVLKPILA